MLERVVGISGATVPSSRCFQPLPVDPTGKAYEGRGREEFGALRRFWANLAGHLSIAGAEGTGNDVPGRGTKPAKSSWLPGLGVASAAAIFRNKELKLLPPGPLARDPCPSCRKASTINKGGLLSNPAFAPP